MNLNLFLGQGVDGRNVYWANLQEQRNRNGQVQ